MPEPGARSAPQEQRRHTDAILDSIADGVFTADPRGRITTFNRAAEQITGRRRAEVLGKPCERAFDAPEGRLEATLREALGGDRPVVNRALYVHRPGGARIPISISVSALRDSADRVIGSVGTFRDLSGVFESYLSGEADDPRGDLRKQLMRQSSFAGIISRSHAMRKIFAILPEIARSGSTVLIQGPSGAGKELFAHAIHDLGPRAQGPLVVVHCGALPDTLLESELFGYRKGAFTGATRDKPGRFTLADGGTIFLDEIGDVSPAMQARLLRVLQDGSFEPLGSTRTLRVDARVIAATNRDLERLVREGVFREDLYYRLNIVRVTVPALRERREDIPLLADHFIARLRASRGKEIVGLSDAVLEALMRHDFPGNVRELENIIEHAFVLCHEGTIEPEHLPPWLPAHLRDPARPGPGSSLDDLQAGFLREALARNRFNVSAAARELGMHRTTLWRKLKKLGIEVERPKK